MAIRTTGFPTGINSWVFIGALAMFALAPALFGQPAGWTQEAGGSYWSGRYNHAAIEFNNKLWVLGGRPAYEATNEVWSSPDGTDWTLETADPGWSPRSGHEVLVFDSRLWVVGGDTSPQTSEVWSSADGINWTLKTDTPAWQSSLFYSAAAVLNGKMWLTGGLDNSFSIHSKVWSSDDGINWTLVTDTPGWPGRIRHAAEAYNGKLWVIGGRLDFFGQTLHNDVWSSADGVNWVLETDTPGWTQRQNSRPATATFDGKLWLLGGMTNAGVRSNEVWTSTDGASWTLENAGADWSGRYGHCAVNFNGEIWVLGGTISGHTTVKPDVAWSSPDGAAWSLQTSWPKRTLHGTCEFDGRLWVLGGSTGDSTELNDVWSSDDGSDWTIHADPAPWSERSNHAVAAFNNRIWVLGGGSAGAFGFSNPLNDVWSSPDGSKWNEKTATPGWPARSGHAAVAFDGKLWVIGGVDSSGEALNDVWSSTDGVNWTPETTDAPWQGRRGHVALVHNSKMWILGGLTTTFANDVWSSTDGVNWTQETSSATWAARAEFAGAVVGNRIWIMGGTSTTGYESDVWSSSDGVAWISEQSAALWPASREGHRVAALNDRLWVLGGADAGGEQLNDVWAYESPIPPTITSTPDTAVAAGMPYKYTVAASGDPTPAFSASNLPGWLTFDNVTGELHGTPDVNDIGLSSVISITASNGYSPDNTQNFQIQVNDEPPVIVSAAPTHATAGQTYAYLIEVTGNPTPTLTINGNPAWLTLTRNELRGTPAAADIGTTGTITITAQNGKSPDDTQDFQIDVEGDPPKITSSPVDTATAGVAYSYSVSTSGAPAPTLSVGALPGWLSFDAGTGELSGTPGGGDVGLSSVITITATNGWAPDATQDFEIQVNGQAPVITSSPPTVANAGSLYTYTITTTGDPTPALTVSSSAAWLTLSGDVLSGTPGASDIGPSGDITVTAGNGTAPDDTQVFQIQVEGTPPSITSTPVTSASIDAVYEYAVTATGTPAPTLSASGLPAWLAFNPMTGELSGTPGAADDGSFAEITITAANGWTPDAAQTFTIHVGTPGGNGDDDDDENCSTSGGGNQGWLMIGLLLVLVTLAVRACRNPAHALGRRLWRGALASSVPAIVVLAAVWMAPELSAQTNPWQRESGEVFTGGIADPNEAAIEFKGRIWAFTRGQAWSSSDGSDWRHEANISVLGISDSERAKVVFDDHIWMIASSAGMTLTEGREVWKSPDGVNWTLVTAQAPWPERALTSVAAFDNKLWVMGGIIDVFQGFAPGNVHDDVWSSPDGVNWTEESPPVNGAPWGERVGGRAVAFDGRLWMIGGITNQGWMNDVWSSTDGQSWTLETAAAGWSPRSGQTVEVFDGKLWAFGGTEPAAGKNSAEQQGLNDVWSSSDGVSWTQSVTSDPHWIPRSQAASFVHNNRLWILGGLLHSGSGKFADAWSTDDGAKWTMEFGVNQTWINGVGQNHWTARGRHAALAFNNKLWVMGGRATNAGDVPDVWSSPHGAAWTMASAGAPWEGRAGFGAVSFGGKLWVMGGLYNGYSNDVWSSSDGVDWVEETLAASWSARSSFGCVVFDNRMWVIGGFPTHSDVWSSGDGVNWVQETASAPFGGVMRGQVTAFNGKLWAVSDEHAGTIWSSDDGANWSLEVVASPWGNDGQYSVEAYNGRLWVLGVDSEVWSSADGVTWIQETADAGWMPRAHRATTVADGKLWLIGGGSAGGHGSSTGNAFNDVWSTTDGATWTLEAGLSRITMTGTMSTKMLADGSDLWLIRGANDDVWSSANAQDWELRTGVAPWGFNRRGFSAVRHNHKLWLMGGANSGHESSDVWSSSDGRDWSLETSASQWAARRNHESLAFNSKLWVLGGSSGGTQLNDVWSSTNGNYWVPENTSPGWSARTYFGAVVFDNRMWVIGGRNGSQLLNDVWSSPNGVSWTQETANAPWSPRESFAVEAYNNRLWLMGGNTGGTSSNYVYNNDVWSSADGVNWVLEQDATEWPPRSRLTSAVQGGKLLIFGGQEPLHGAGGRNDLWSWQADPAPEITSSPVTDATANATYTFRVHASGTPAPTIAASNLPSWLSVNGDTLTGTPSSSDVGSTGLITVTATNSHGADTLDFQIDVQAGQAPQFTSSPVTTVAVGAAYSYTVSADGTPAPSLSVGTLPGWLSFDAMTNELSGTPGGNDVGLSGTIDITATNGVSPDAVQSFQIQVEGIPPAITSTPETTATIGLPYSYTIDATGAPAPAISVGTLPGWLNFNPSTGELYGTPDLGDVGLSVTISVTADNGWPPDDTQDFQIQVNGYAPVITSTPPAAPATVGSVYSYNISATGNPVPSFSVSGNPAWLTLSGNTLSGVPGVGDIGSSGDITITASNGTTPDGTQVFQVQVDGVPPQFTSTPVTTAEAGTAYTYTATVTGEPEPALSVGTLPGWLSFNPTTGELFGTPADGDTGTVTIVITATNGWGSDAVQSFDIVVTAPLTGGDDDDSSGGCVASGGTDARWWLLLLVATAGVARLRTRLRG